MIEQAGSALAKARADFFVALNKDVHVRDVSGAMSNSDSNNETSKAIADLIAQQTGFGKCKKRPDGQTLGDLFEGHVSRFIESVFPKLRHLRPGTWRFPAPGNRKSAGFFEFEQYAHLKELNELVKTSRRIQASLGNDYVIAPDIVVVRDPPTDAEINAHEMIVDATTGALASLRADLGAKPFFHASISCKWTLRSDRAQNARSEALNLIRNRKGRAPHIAVVTAEPLPSRIASLALGTGDLDCVYHFALPELRSALSGHTRGDSKELLEIMIEGKRLKDISDLPLDLAV